MKKLLTLTLISMLASCGGDGNVPLPMSGAQSSPPSAPGTPSTPSGSAAATTEASAFLVQAYLDGVNEIALSRLALDRASDENVRMFAQAMIGDHTQANEEMRLLAQAKNVALPTEATTEQNATLQTLSNLSGVEFDRAYMDHNVAVHAKDVAEFRQQSVAGTDPDVKRFASNTLPVLQIHLLGAKGINGMIDPNDFLVNAFIDGKAEIMLSNLALQKSTNQDVVAFARRMIDDHTRANATITQLAQTKGIALPTDLTVDHSTAYDEASKMIGADFDKAYMNHNVIVHELAVAQANAQAQRGTDPEIKTLASGLLPDLRSHRDTANAIYRTIEPSFLAAAFEDGQGEILLSKLALQKASDAEVKQFAQRMIDDHTRANSEILQLAQSKNLQVPTEVSVEHAASYLDLFQRSGAEFDTAYISRNVAVHGKDVTKAQEQSNNAADADLRAFAARTLPVLAAHLDSARQIESRLNSTGQ